MTVLTKPVVRETPVTIRGRRVVVELEPRSILLRLKGEGVKGERYRFTLEQLFYHGARRAADEAALDRARSRWRS